MGLSTQVLSSHCGHTLDVIHAGPCGSPVLRKKTCPKASEAMQLFKEANRMLNELDAAYQTHGVVNIMDANADGDDLLLNSKRFPLLRQQTAKLKEDGPVFMSE